MITPEEWMRQADYDFETAECMFQSARYIYAVYMCHLVVEKALKAAFQKSCKQNPPKTHSLAFLLEQANLTPPESLDMFLTRLNEAQITTRYPEDLMRAQSIFNKDLASGFLRNTKEMLTWIKEQL